MGVVPTAFINGAASTASFVNGIDLTCTATLSDGCAAVMPRVQSVALFAGAESRHRMRSAHLLIGPAEFFSPNRGRLDALPQSDLSSAPRYGLADVLSTRLSVIPKIVDATSVMRSVTLGLRFGG